MTFKVVTSFPDLKVQFVDSFGDYKVKMASNNSFSKETIKIQIVTSFQMLNCKRLVLLVILKPILIRIEDNKIGCT